MDGAHIQVCHPVRMFPVITDVAYTNRVYRLPLIVLRVINALLCWPSVVSPGPPISRISKSLDMKSLQK
jgi:hypothetical protein